MSRATGHQLAMSEPARWFIGAGTTAWSEETGLEDRPELGSEVERVAGLFSSLGYRQVPGFGLNQDAAEFLGRLRSFLTSRERRSDDIVAVYYTGHGIREGDELLLPMADATADLSFTAMPAADLTGRLLRGPLVVQRLLFLLDTCYAAAAGRAMTSDAIEFINRLRGVAVSPSVAIVVGARPAENAESGAFSRAFEAAVAASAGDGDEPDFLDLDDLVKAVNVATPEWQHARVFMTGDGFSGYFPNPRYGGWLRDQELGEARRIEILKRRRAEERDHILPRAQGLDASTGNDEDRWLFTGREQALRAVCSWLKSQTGPATMVVTGDPGSGKSALLSRLYVLAGDLRSRVRHLNELPEFTVPPPGSITRFINARGLTADQVMAGLCEACDVSETTSPGTLLASVAGRGAPVVVIVDGIDEVVATPAAGSEDRAPIIDRVLSPLVRAAGRTRLRLLLGTRRNSLSRPGQLPASGQLPARPELTRVIDLDQSTYADPDGVAAYARSCLVSLPGDAPYREQPADYLAAVATAIAAAAGNSFLVALITARSLALSGELADPASRDWRDSLPQLVADAMHDDFGRRLGTQAERARGLLLPLAYAQGDGLPWEDVWPHLVRELTGNSCRDRDLDWLFQTVGFYITRSRGAGDRSPAYRLYHGALA